MKPCWKSSTSSFAPRPWAYLPISTYHPTWAPFLIGTPHPVSMSESITGRDPFNTSKAMRVLAFALLCFLIAAPLRGQKEKREPLTEAQQDQVAEAGIDPVARIDLYVKFLNEHADTIKGLIPRAHSSARNSRLENELEDFTA